MADFLTDDELQQALAQVARRASVDSEFRALALKDSTAAIAKINPKPVPTDIDFKFMDNSGKTKHLALPDPVPGIDELSPSELEAVAGGDWTAAVDAGTGTAGGHVGWSR